MHVVDALKKLNFLPPEKLLELYPPFLFMGVKVKSVAADYRKLHVRLPLRWYGRNQYGTMFGGFMCAVSDPLPALLCGRIFPGHEVWTRANTVEFLIPASSMLDIEIEITQADIDLIESELSTTGKASPVFEFYFRDREKRQVAFCRNTVFIRRRK